MREYVADIPATLNLLFFHICFPNIDVLQGLSRGYLISENVVLV